MKYEVQIEINLPIDRVVELFDNPDNLAKWQPGLQEFKHLEGEPGQPGAKSHLRYKMGKREIEMVETILVRDLPTEFSATYEAKGVWNKVSNYFSPLDNNRTLYRSESEFKFESFGMKAMAFLMPGAFKKQSLKYLQQFKDFAEAEG